MGILDTIKDLFAGKKVEEKQTEEKTETTPQEDSYEGGEASDAKQAE